MSVKVAVRVRPFLPREVERKAKCCIDMVRRVGSLIAARPYHEDSASRHRRYSNLYVRLLVLVA